MPRVDLPDGDRKIGGTTSAGVCALVCVGKCNCTAYSYGRNRCFVCDDEFTNVKQIQCGDTSNNNQATLYLRLTARELEKLQKRRAIKYIAIGASVVSFGLLF
jgi:hypothetical protein